MKAFYAGGFLVFAALVFMSWYWRAGADEVTTFYGIVDTTETVVSAEIAVEISSVYVEPGQRVNAGDTLVRLASAELEKSIAELRFQLNEAKADRITGDREIQAKVSELEAQYNLNTRLLAQVRGNDVEPGHDDRAEDNPLTAAIGGLKSLLARDQLSTADMEAYSALLLREKDKLVVLATDSGVISAVNHRAGEKVQAFRPILSMHTGAPTLVNGYLHESVHGIVEFGRAVRVRSMATPYEVEGQVVGVGHRIVEYPVRLRKRPDIQIWGREVTVRIPPGSSFLLGEKVMIRLEPSTKKAQDQAGAGSLLPGLSAHAAPPPGNFAGSASGAHPQAVRAAVDWTLPGVEASGLVYLPDVGAFWVISDDTPDKNPIVYRVDPEGRLQGTTLVQGLPAINDLEAIALDGKSTVYLSTSMSRNKKGKQAKERGLLVRALRSGDTMRLDATVNLREVLQQALEKAPGELGEWFRLAESEHSLDLEGIAPHEGGMLLGFKAPLWKGRAVILRIRDVSALFGNNASGPDAISLWRTVELRSPASKFACGVSDLMLRDGTLHILGTSEGHKGGGWWTVNAQQEAAARLVRSFRNENPEGIVFDPSASVYRVAFDAGSSLPSPVRVFPLISDSKPAAK